ncbi:unnamed protein product [Rotaria sordida]|uniref:Uncharacterized protein n=1 Tax=Rotaria sordida TaxID=392033 RepID=A0A815QCI0_9BILA|nr:unnamed protein product [Rotaria sordida]
MKTYKHIALIQLSDIQSLFDINPLSLTIDETEQFRIICSIDGQIRQLILCVINENTNTSSNSSESYFTDSMSSLLSISILSNSTPHHGNIKTYLLYQLTKSSLIQTSLENSDIDSD